MSKYLIDYENVYIEGLDGLENLTEQDEVCIFYTLNRCGMTFDLHKRFLKSKAAIKLLEVSSAPPKNPFSKTSLSNSIKNALDLQLTLYLGYLISSENEGDIFIISKDNDFGLDLDFCEKYFENCNTNVFLFQTIQKALDKDIVVEEVPEEIEMTLTDDIVASDVEDVAEESDDSVSSNEQIEKTDEKMYLAEKKETALAVDRKISTTLLNTVENLFENNGVTFYDDEIVNSVCEYIKSSEDLLAFNNNLASLLRDGEKVKLIYHIIKPQFTILKSF